MRPSRLATVLVVLAAVAGCDSGDSSDSGDPAPTPTAAEGRVGAGEGRVVRGWIDALNRGDYDKAASYFARGAIVDQGRAIRLPSRAAARVFNASLPCRADLVDVKNEPGPRALASFRLRAGPGGPCDGTARVRVTVEDGRFTVWRQLPQALEPSGPVV